MPPKAQPEGGQPVSFLMKVRGGGPVNPGALAPKVGTLGLAPKVVGDKICESTKDYRGIRCIVKVTIQNRQAEVEIVPTSSLLVVKALGETKSDKKKGEHKKHDGNITFDDVIQIAKTMRSKSNAKRFTGTVKEILGTCVSVGCTVDGASPKTFIAQINSGELFIEEYEAPQEGEGMDN